MTAASANPRRPRALDPTGFEIYGVIAVRNKLGRPYFNFPQRIWISPRIAMNWSSRPSRAVETLAINILAHFIPEQRGWISGNHVGRKMLRIAQLFAADFLLTMPPMGGRIPREVILEWLRDVGLK